jgi:hypothetical protein
MFRRPGNRLEIPNDKGIERFISKVNEEPMAAFCAIQSSFHGEHEWEVRVPRGTDTCFSTTGLLEGHSRSNVVQAKSSG